MILVRSMVPKAGLEPARLSPHAPQTCVSAIPPLRQPTPYNDGFRVTSHQSFGRSLLYPHANSRKLETRNSQQAPGGCIIEVG